MKKLNQKGFGLVEALLIIIIVIVLAAIGWFVWQRRSDKGSTNTNSNTSATSGRASTGTPSASSQYKTYTSATEKSSFKYPASWTLSSEPASGYNGDSATLTSPNGKVAVYWRSGITGLGGACGPPMPTSEGGCPTINFDKITPTQNDPNYVVVEGVVESTKYQNVAEMKNPDGVLYTPILFVDNKVDKHRVLNDHHQGLFYPTFNGRETDSYEDMLSITKIGQDSDSQAFATEQEALDFRQTSDYKAAKKILLSYHY